MANCFEGYIDIDNSTPARSGLYATLLPGIDTDMLDGIAKTETTPDEVNVWTMIYTRAQKNLIADVSRAIQDKFYINHKLTSKETSSFKDTWNSGGTAGITLEYFLPMYATLHVITLEVWSQVAITGAPITFYDTDVNGELLYQKSVDLSVGRNTIYIDQNFQVDKLFISYDANVLSLRQTENRYYNRAYDYFDSVLCEFPFYEGSGSIEQINGGGFNVVYDIFCNIERFVCQNLNLFARCLWWKVGYEVMVERRLTERLNKFTTMTFERAKELQDEYGANFDKELTNAIKSQNIYEDEYCFQCKDAVTTTTLIP